MGLPEPNQRAIVSSRKRGVGFRMTRILLVEDEFLVRELAFEDLNDAGFDVRVAGSGDEAIALLEGDRAFDLLFTDIRMPGSVDGWELARRARDCIPSLGVIYATGYSDRLKVLESNERFLQKPYRASEVLAAVRDLTGDASAPPAGQPG